MMRLKAQARRRERGFILAWVLIVIIALIGLGTALMYLATWEGTAVAMDVSALRAFNLAEAGIDWGIWQLSLDPDWVGDTFTLDSNNCVVTTEDLGSDWYRVTATASVAGQQRIVSLNVEVIDSALPWPLSLTDYAIYWGGEYDGGGDFELQNNVSINGPVFANGDMEITRNASIYNGTVYSTGTIYGSGSYSATEAPEDAPEPFEPDTAAYDELLDQAADEGGGDWTLSGSSTYNLSGGTLFVDGDVLIENNTVVYGPGRIVATGSITVQNNAQVLDSVDLIAGQDFSAKNLAIIEGQGNVIYGADSVSVENLAAINPLTPVNLASPGSSFVLAPPGSETLVENLAHIRGVVWVDKLEMKNNSAIYGTMYVSEFDSNEMENNAYVHYDPTVLDDFDELPDGLPEGEETEVSVTLGEWAEGAVE